MTDYVCVKNGAKINDPMNAWGPNVKARTREAAIFAALVSGCNGYYIAKADTMELEWPLDPKYDN